ncbi:MAG: cytochrome c [Gammaproteobacteria bacterium]|nr:cytochrome c [Gammaproteobacteria bacterium]
MLRGLVMCIVLSGIAAPALAANVFNGKEVFNRHCASCHGRSGEGIMPGMPNFTHGDRLFTKPDETLRESIRQGSGIMPGFSAILNDQDIQDVVAYLRSLL